MRYKVDPFLFCLIGMMTIVVDATADSRAEGEEDSPISGGEFSAEIRKSYVVVRKEGNKS